jgi:hypothetical protein
MKALQNIHPETITGSVDLGFAILTFARLSKDYPITRLADLPDYVEHLVDAQTGEIFPVLVYAQKGEVSAENYDIGVVLGHKLDAVIEAMVDGRDIVFDATRLFNGQQQLSAALRGVKGGLGQQAAYPTGFGARSPDVQQAELTTMEPNEVRGLWKRILTSNLAGLLNSLVTPTGFRGQDPSTYEPSMSVSIRAGQITSIVLHNLDSHQAFYIKPSVSDEEFRYEKAQEAQRNENPYGGSGFTHLFQYDDKAIRFMINSRPSTVMPRLMPEEALTREAIRIYEDAVNKAAETVFNSRTARNTM